MGTTTSTLRQTPRAFRIHGPFDVIKLNVREIDFFNSDNSKKLYKQVNGAAPYARDKGCYVFARRHGDSYTPLYVGKTSQQDFQSEVFALQKQKKCIMGLLKPTRGQLVLFLLSANRKPGSVPKETVKALEKYLIREAALRNPNLWNEHGTKPDPFQIVGIHKAGRGKPCREVATFKNMLFS